MNRNCFIYLFIVLASLHASAAVVVNENFSGFKIPSSPYITISGSTSLPAGCTKDPDNIADNNGNPIMVWNFPLVPPGYNWSMVISTVYPFSFKGYGPTQAWAYDSTPVSQLRFHAERTEWDMGFGWVNNTILNKNKNLTVEARVTLDYCRGNGTCTNGPALINTEADYRAVYLQSNGSNQLNLIRYAPCDARPLYYASGAPVTLPISTPVNIRLDYTGASDGSWHYSMNGVDIFIKDNNGSLVNERGDFLNATLKDNARAGLYPNVNGDRGNFVEGRIFWIRANQLEKITGITATSSRNDTGSNASLAIDNNANTFWSAGTHPPAWIELDLKAARSIKKIRLLVSQYPAGNTTHNVYIGSSPAPTALKKTLTSYTKDGDWIDINLDSLGEQGRYVRIQTSSSLSWVSWREIEVYD